MTRTELRDDHHVVRYCPLRALDNDGRPTLVAFDLRDDESYLSANWLEYFQDTAQRSRIDQVREAMSRRLTLGRRGRLLELEVEDVKEAGSTVGCALRIEPRDDDDDPSHGCDDPSHVGIDGWQSDAEHALVAAQLLEIARRAPLHPAKL